MNVLFLIESLETKSGGPALEIANLASRLSEEEDISITILVRSTDEEEFPVNEAVHIERLSPNKSAPNWIKGFNKIRETVRTSDVVYVTGIWGPLDGLAFSFSGAKRFYIRTCGMLEPYILNRNKWKKWPARMIYVDRNLRRAAGLIVNSSPEKSRVEALKLNENVLIIPNGVPNPPKTLNSKETVRRKFKIPGKKRVLLYLGRIHPKKGLDKFIRATIHAEKSGSIDESTFIAVGGDFFSDGFKNEINQLIADGGLEDSIKFFGHVNGQEKEDLFSLADAFLLPSESEGLPNAVLEAMARSLPLLITEGCNIPEVSEYNAGHLMQYSVDSMEDGLRWFHGECKNMQSMGKNAYRLRNQQFSTQACLDAYRELIFES